MRFTHKDCGGVIVVYLNESFDFYSFFSFSKDGIRVDNLFIKNINNSPKLYCLDCKKVVEYSLDNILLYCDSCHNEKPLSEFKFHDAEAGYSYCIDCVKRHHVNDMNTDPPDKIKF